MKVFPKLEQLENRVTPAVSISVNAQGLMSIIGDGADDDVEVMWTGVNNVLFETTNLRVFTQENDGGFVDRGVFLGVKSINANMGYGEDELYLSAVQIKGNLTVVMDPKDSDNDNHEIFDLDTNRGFEDIGVRGHVYIGGNVKVDMGPDHRDLVEWDGDSDRNLGILVRKNVTIKNAEDIDLNGQGGTANYEQSDINIQGNLKVSGAVEGDDDESGDGYTFRLDDVNVNGKTDITLSDDGDDAAITDCIFLGNVKVNLLAGDDRLELGGGDTDGNGRSIAVGKVLLDGGDDFDTLADLAVPFPDGNLYGSVQVINFEEFLDIVLV